MTRLDTSVKVSGKSQLVNKVNQCSVRDVRDGTAAEVASQCTDVSLRMYDNVMLCSALVGV